MDELQRFEQLVSRRAGISLREQERETLRKLLKSRLSVLGMSSLEAYFQLLESGGTAGEAEWTQLFVLLTNNETYFFRDSSQLSVLRERILPELIEKNRSHRTLRLWSAGCSTGEEPFSLAMMVDELLGLQPNWKVLILGTDLSEAALNKARSGIYGSWSFRSMSQSVQNRYFSPQNKSDSKNAKSGAQNWVLNERIRKMVVFKQNNLWHDSFPSPASLIHDIDLIVCRNVFIYFSRDAVTKVLGKFARTLRSDGYLLTGHAELHDIPLQGLQLRAFPQTIIYQNSINATANAANSASVAKVQAPSRPVALPIKETPKMTPVAPITPSPSRSLLPTKTVLTTPTSASPPSRDGAARVELAPTDAIGAKREKVGDETVAILRQVERDLSEGKSQAALKNALQVLQKQPNHYRALCLAAQAQANGGHHEAALELCRRASQSEAFSPLAYQLMARIEEDRGNVEAAKTLLKKVIYLAPSSVWPYLEMESLYRREGDIVRAQTMRRAAFKVLASLPPETPLPDDTSHLSAHGGQNLTARQLLAHMQDEKMQSKS